jgi:acetyl-CoA C-acetyltransferase
VDAYIVEAVRTPVGRRAGGLARIHPADLAAHVITELVRRADIDPAACDDVVLGCIDAVGSQAGDIARTAWLAAGLPETVPGVTIDRQCGSSQQAVHFAAQAVMSGTADLVVAGGVQSMSQIPLNSALSIAAESLGIPDPWSGSEGWRARYADAPVNQFLGAESIARRWEIARDEMEELALRSHERALTAWDEGRFDREVTPIAGVMRDEGPRPDTSAAKLATLRTLLPDGLLTAGVSSQISDGAAALLVASADAVRRHGLRPRARIVHLSALGGDPLTMLDTPIAATRRALDRAGLTVDDIDLFEVNEAFAPVVLAWLREIQADPERVNVNGGAIALGHPIGASGARIMTTLLHELERTDRRFGLQTMCEGGGQANVTVIERLS